MYHAVDHKRNEQLLSKFAKESQSAKYKLNQMQPKVTQMGILHCLEQIELINKAALCLHVLWALFKVCIERSGPLLHYPHYVVLNIISVRTHCC